MFGHMVGDELLCAVARRLEIAADGDFVVPRRRRRVHARMQPWADAAEGRRGAGESPAAGRRRPLRGARPEDPASASASAPPSIRTTAPTRSTLLANADAALYRAKEDGRQTVRFFDPEIDRRLRERFALQIDLRSAIAATSCSCTISRRPRSTARCSASRPWRAGSTRRAASSRRASSSRSPSRTA